MLLKTFAVAAGVAMLVVSAAVAAPPAGKGKPVPTGPACKPKISVILKGTLTEVPSTTASFTVTGGNRFAKVYKPVVTVTLTADTKITRGNSDNLADLKIGDLVNVRAVVCKADLALDPPPALIALRLVAHPAKS